MKRIKNTGYQAVQICLSTPTGPEFVNLKPRASVVVEDRQLTHQLTILHKRRRIEITKL